MDKTVLFEKILQESMDRAVSQKMDEIKKNMDFTKGLSSEEVKELNLMLLEIGKKSAENYFSKMKERIEKKGN